MKINQKAIVIGAGIGGLATAALLAKNGYEVIVLEKNSLVGGRARFLKLDDFWFDMGPSWYMMPEVFENFFALFGKKIEDFYELVRLKNHYRVFYEEDDNFIDVSSDLKKNFETFANFEENGEHKLAKILQKSKLIYETAMKDLVFLDYKNWRDVVSPKILRYLWQFNFFESLHNYLKKNITNDKLRKILEFTTVFLGGSPYNTPAFYQLVTHADFDLGIYYPKGGIYKIVESLQALVLENGASIRTNEEVLGIKISDDKISEVRTNKGRYSADLVVVNADMAFFEQKILPPKYQTYPKSFWQKKTLSPSAFLIYLGLRDNLPKSQHHNLYFTKDWNQHFGTVYKTNSLPENPSFYWHVPSKTCPEMAPSDHHSVMILVPISAKIKMTTEEVATFERKIIAKFAQLNGISNIQDKIVVKKIYTGRDFETDYHALAGSAFGIAHTLWQTAIFRPKNFSRKLKNLYYVGHHTNPGVGMPPVLISSQIVFNLIKKQENAKHA